MFLCTSAKKDKRQITGTERNQNILDAKDIQINNLHIRIKGLEKQIQSLKNSLISQNAELRSLRSSPGTVKGFTSPVNNSNIITCSLCGNRDTVPFSPRFGAKNLLCRRCYRQQQDNPLPLIANKKNAKYFVETF